MKESLKTRALGKSVPSLVYVLGSLEVVPGDMLTYEYDSLGTRLKFVFSMKSPRDSIRAKSPPPPPFFMEILNSSMLRGLTVGK